MGTGIARLRDMGADRAEFRWPLTYLGFNEVRPWQVSVYATVQMPNSKALASLRSAILEERIARADAKKVLERYNTFTAKLRQFQTQSGPGPTQEEFETWRNDILLVWAIREEELKKKSAAMVPPSDKKNVENYHAALRKTGLD